MRKTVCFQLICVEGQVLWRGRFAKPLHVAFDEDLHALAANTASAFQRPPGTAAGGHMRSEFHLAQTISGRTNGFNLIERGGDECLTHSPSTTQQKHNNKDEANAIGEQG